jgi:hypothetical protein
VDCRFRKDTTYSPCASRLICLVSLASSTCHYQSSHHYSEENI